MRVLCTSEVPRAFGSLMKAWPPRQFGGSSPVVTCLRHSMVVWERGEGEAMSGVRRGDGRRGARARTARGTGVRAGGWRAAGLKAARERRRRVPSCRSRSFRRSCECKQQQQTAAPRSAFLNLRGGAMRARGRGGRAQGERLVKLDDLRVVRREGSDAARGRKGYGCHQRKAHAAGGSERAGEDREIYPWIDSLSIDVMSALKLSNTK